ncbi:MAG TPA: xanthine dehydrogenase family protein subunit M [Chloroflexota bacterium]
MKPPPFDYVDPQSVPEALEVLQQCGEDGKPLAGGQSLVPLLNMRLAQPRVLVDLNRIPALAYITARSLDGSPGVAIGSMTRHRAVEKAGAVLDGFPLLREAIGWVGHPQIRNRGSVGGSIAHADPSAELPLVFLALDGVATVRSASVERTVPASEFFLYTFTPSLEPDELLTEIWLPLAGRRTGQAFVEIARRHGDFALVAAAASLTLDSAGVVSEARVAIGGAAPLPVRIHAAEDMLRGERAGLDRFREAARLVRETVEPSADVHADAEYRREVAGVLALRALTTAFERVPNENAEVTR